ncbi:MAG: polysaccharide pyruvyl transferase family protein [Bacilli bacterium]|nr:polysaccharide pyruvyl transferase family protein [Bacilli bacterium]
MKICIVTVYNSYNFGSFLQAKNLYNYILNQGYDAVFYNGKSRKLFRACARKIKKNIITNKSIIKIIKGTFFELKEYFILKKAWESLPSTCSRKGFDCVVVGSDEIWNISRLECQKDEFWADGFDCPKISYAPSINTTKSELFLNSKYVELLKKFDCISVRDEYSKKTLSTYCNKSIDVVVDPTFLNSMSVSSETQNFIAVYLFYGSLTQQEINDIISFAHSKNMKLVSLGQYISWCDKCIHSINGMPFYEYKNAKYVITNTFHGTAYAINYRKQFITYSKGKNKIVELLDSFNLGNRDITNENIMDKFNEIIDYSKINNKINNNIDHSKNYLCDAIRSVKK